MAERRNIGPWRGPHRRHLAAVPAVASFRDRKAKDLPARSVLPQLTQAAGPEGSEGFKGKSCKLFRLGCRVRKSTRGRRSPGWGRIAEAEGIPCRPVVQVNERPLIGRPQRVSNKFRLLTKSGFPEHPSFLSNRGYGPTLTLPRRERELIKHPLTPGVRHGNGSDCGNLSPGHWPQSRHSGAKCVCR